jgi:hypothetical protein
MLITTQETMLCAFGTQTIYPQSTFLTRYPSYPGVICPTDITIDEETGYIEYWLFDNGTQRIEMNAVTNYGHIQFDATHYYTDNNGTITQSGVSSTDGTLRPGAADLYHRTNFLIYFSGHNAMTFIGVF